MNKIIYYYSKVLQKLRGKAVYNSIIAHSSSIGSGCNLINVRMGKYSYCGHDCEILNASIGSFCSISDHVYIGGAEHPMDWASMSPVFQNVKHSGPKKRFSRVDLPDDKETIIGNDVWIGHGVSIKQGVTIGHGAVIGSNAVVTKDVPPYAVVAGVPAKIIKYRFDKSIIDILLGSNWWDSDDDALAVSAKYIQDPLLFVKSIKVQQDIK